MKACDSLRSTLSRIAEGETRPDEALRVARHLSDCTACRILLAREMRLAEMIEGLRDPDFDEQAFLDRVMRALPHELPAAVEPRRLKRRLRLACTAGAAMLAGVTAARLIPLATDVVGTRLSFPARIDLESLGEVLASVAGLGRLAARIWESVSAFHGWFVVAAARVSPVEAWSAAAFCLSLLLVTATVVITAAARNAQPSLSAVIRSSSFFRSIPSRAAAALLSPCSADSARSTK
jgi:predicted anti-sigma-YlaC factor YlaD